MEARGLEQESKIDIDVLITLLKNKLIRPENLPDELFMLDQSERASFAEKYCEIAATSDDQDLFLDDHQKKLFMLFIAHPTALIRSNAKFIQFLAKIKQFAIDDCFQNILELMRLNDIEATAKNLEYLLSLIEEFHVLKSLDVNVEALRNNITGITNTSEFNECVYQAHVDLAAAKKMVLKSAQTKDNNGKTDDKADSFENLSQYIFPDETPTKPKKDYSRLKWFLVGALIGFVAAGIAVACVVSIGGVPAGLTLVTGILTVVGMAIGSPLLSGLVSLGIKKFKMWLDDKGSEPKLYQPKSFRFAFQKEPFIYTDVKKDEYNSDSESAPQNDGFDSDSGIAPQAGTQDSKGKTEATLTQPTLLARTFATTSTVTTPADNQPNQSANSHPNQNSMDVETTTPVMERVETPDADLQATEKHFRK